MNAIAADDHPTSRQHRPIWVTMHIIQNHLQKCMHSWQLNHKIRLFPTLSLISTHAPWCGKYGSELWFLQCKLSQFRLKHI